MNRHDYIETIQTKDGPAVNISSDGDVSNCLLQVRNLDNKFTCAYLTDEEAKKVADSIYAYLAIPIYKE